MQLLPLSAVLITFVFLTSMKASLKLISLETRKHALAALTELSFCLSKGPRGLLFETKSTKLQRVITSLQKFLIVARAALDVQGINGKNICHQPPLMKYGNYLNSHLLE